MTIKKYEDRIIVRKGAKYNKMMMKIYEIITKRSMIQKKILDAIVAGSNDNFYADNYESSILFNSYEDALNFFEISKKEISIKLVKGYFGMCYYSISSIFLNELIVDNSFVKSCDELNTNKIAIYQNIISDNLIDKKSNSIEDAKNYIKEGK